jgi:hypothetical protein
MVLKKFGWRIKMKISPLKRHTKKFAGFFISKQLSLMFFQVEWKTLKQKCLTWNIFIDSYKE